MKKTLLAILASCFVISILQSQDWQSRRGEGQPEPLELKLKVIDEETGLALEFATLSVFSAGDSSLVTGGLADADGLISVNVRPGKYYGLLEFLSYESTKIDPIEVSPGNSVDLGEIKLAVSGLQLEEVEIRAEKSETQFMLDKKVFNVGQDIAGRGGTAEDVLDNVPSITVDIDGNVSLRGNSGVRILIDGRPSALAGVGDENGLRQLSAEMVDRVEVITNPSARYEAEGTAGIINIILKKDTRVGFNGAFNGSLGYPEQGSIGANVNYRKGDINWFANYSLRKRSSPGGGILYQEIYDGDDTYITDQTRDSDRESISNSFRGGFDYFLTDKENITGSFLFRTSDQDNLGVVTYNDYFNDLNTFVSKTIRNDNETEDRTNFEYSLNYRKEFSERTHELKATIQYEFQDEGENSLYDEDLFLDGGPGENVLNQRSFSDQIEKNWLIQADYIQPMGEGHMFETGFRSSLRSLSNDYLVEEFADGDWFNLEGLSNDFIYDENIHAVYGTYGNKFGRFSFQTGLRTEWSFVKTELVTTNEINDRDYVDFFPSIFFNYEMPFDVAFQASYSRRLRRPRHWDLNPFFSFSDDRNIFGGNPNIEPEYSNSYELSAIKYTDVGTLTASLFYRHTDGEIERIRTLNLDGTTTTIPMNLATKDDMGLELTFSYSGVKWWRLDGSANFFRSKTDGSNVDQNFSADSFTWHSRMTNRFTFWNKTDLQMRFNYRGPRETTQGRNKGSGSLDLGLSKDFMDNKLTLTFNVRDLFESRKRNHETFGENFYSSGEYYWRGRTFSLNATYRLNQKKQRERRENGEDYEQGNPEFQIEGGNGGPGGGGPGGTGPGGGGSGSPQ